VIGNESGGGEEMLQSSGPGGRLFQRCGAVMDNSKSLYFRQP